jgi:hypothetical protein
MNIAKIILKLEDITDARMPVESFGLSLIEAYARGNLSLHDSPSGIVHYGCETVSLLGAGTSSIVVTGGTQRLTIPSDEIANRVFGWQVTMGHTFGALMVGIYQG